jgi:hypothetical protein
MYLYSTKILLIVPINVKAAQSTGLGLLFIVVNIACRRACALSGFFWMAPLH